MNLRMILAGAAHFGQRNYDEQSRGGNGMPAQVPGVNEEFIR